MFVLITISNTKSKRVNENITRQCTRAEEEEEDEEHGNSVKIEITRITPVLQAILDFFPDIISFQHVFHLGVGRSQIEWKLKAKTQISVFQWAKIGQNDHSNPYIESTTVLSDIPDNNVLSVCLKSIPIITIIEVLKHTLIVASYSMK